MFLSQNRKVHLYCTNLSVERVHGKVEVTKEAQVIVFCQAQLVLTALVGDCLHKFCDGTGV